MTPTDLAAPEFQAALDSLINSGQQLLELLQQSGPIDTEGGSIAVRPHSKTRKLYARLRRPGRKKQEGLGAAGNPKHIAAVEAIERGLKVEQLREILESIDAIASCDGWANIPAPAAPVLKIDQGRYVPPGGHRRAKKKLKVSYIKKERFM